MNNASLQDFVKTTSATNRITFGDVKRLRRTILPEGLISREEVEQLLDLDATVGRRDQAWTDWLVSAVVDYAVWGERPTGYVEGEAAAWIVEALSRHGMATKAARLIAREIEREAEAVDETIEELAIEAAADDELDVEVEADADDSANADADHVDLIEAVADFAAAPQAPRAAA